MGVQAPFVHIPPTFLNGPTVDAYGDTRAVGFALRLGGFAPSLLGMAVVVDGFEVVVVICATLEPGQLVVDLVTDVDATVA